MDMDEAENADNKELLQVAETYDSCVLDYIEIVPLARDTNDSCATACVSGDGFGEGMDVDLAGLKQEPHDVCCIFYYNRKSLFRSLVIGQVFRSVQDSGWHTYNLGSISIEENFNMFSIIEMWLFP